MAIRKLKGDGLTKLSPPIVAWGENEISIEIHCDAGEILTKTGIRAQIGIFGFLRKQITDRPKNVEFRQWVAVSWVSRKALEKRLVFRGKYKHCFTVATWRGG